MMAALVRQRMMHARPLLQRAALSTGCVRRDESSDEGSTSFIQRVKVKGANALLGAFTSANGYDSAFKDLRVTRVDTGAVEARLVISKALTNSYGTLHGGAAATLVDIAGTMALLSKDPLRAGVSVEINTTYMAAVPIGEEVLIKGRLLKSGRRMGFTTVDIYRADGSIAVTGRHTKAL